MFESKYYGYNIKSQQRKVELNAVKRNSQRAGGIRMEKSGQGLLPGESAPGAAEMRTMLEGVAREIASLDLLRRTLLSGMIRQQSGMSVDDWIRAAGRLETLMQAIRQGRDGDADGRSRTLLLLAEWKGKLERLASCFQTAARLAGGHVKKPGDLTGARDVLAQREQVIHGVIREIEQLERG